MLVGIIIEVPELYIYAFKRLNVSCAVGKISYPDTNKTPPTATSAATSDNSGRGEEENEEENEDTYSSSQLVAIILSVVIVMMIIQVSSLVGMWLVLQRRKRYLTLSAQVKSYGKSIR